MTSSSKALIDELIDRFDRSTNNLREALKRFIDHGERPDADARASGAFAYPEIRIRYGGDTARSKTGRAWGRLAEAGTYSVSVTQPRLFRDYLAEQLDFLMSNYDIEVEVGASKQEIIVVLPEPAKDICSKSTRSHGMAMPASVR